MRDGDGVKPFVKMAGDKPVYHPACLVLPEMGEAEFRELAADITEHGQRHPIIVDVGGVILDGRHRWRALAEAGREAELQVFDGSEAEKVSLIISENVKRRHLTTGQRAAIGAELANMRHGTNQFEKKVEGSFDLSSPPAEPTEKADPPPAVSIAQAAQLMGVSEPSVKRAKKVMHTDPIAHEAAKRGDKPKKTNTNGKTPPPAQKSPRDHRPETKLALEIIQTLLSTGEEVSGKIVAEQAGVSTTTAKKAINLYEAEKAASQKPLPDFGLSASARQRLDAAIAAHKAKLDQEHDECVRIEAMKWVEEIRIPIYEEKLKKIERMLIRPSNAVMLVEEYKKILMCLHPDGLHSRTEEQLAEAFKIFTYYKPKMVADEEVRKSVLSALPRTREEMLARKTMKRKV